MVAGAVVAGAVVVVVAVLSAFLLQTVKLKSIATTRSATIAHFPKLFLFILSPSLFPIYMRTLNVFFLFDSSRKPSRVETCTQRTRLTNFQSPQRKNFLIVDTNPQSKQILHCSSTIMAQKAKNVKRNSNRFMLFIP